MDNSSINNINRRSSKDIDEERVMHSKSDKIEFIIYDNADEVIEEAFEYVLNRYQIGLETSLRGSCFIFGYLLYYKCHKINPNCGGIVYRFPRFDKKQRSNNKSHQ